MAESSALLTQVQDLTTRNEDVSNTLQALQQEVECFKTDLEKTTREKEALEVFSPLHFSIR